MNTVIQFTPAQLVTGILFICTAIITVSTVLTVMIKAVQKVKEPEETQNERISSLESEVDKIKQFLNNDNKRLIELEKGNRVTQQALLALLSHAINGNNETELKNAKDKLQNYLIGKEE